MFDILILVKLLITVLLVIILSLIAEHISTRFAGILAGFPTTTVIVLFFIGLEISPSFASESALYNLVGIVATQVFLYCYYKTSLHLKSFQIVFSSIFAVLGFLAVIYLLHFLKVDIILAILVPIVSIILFFYLFKDIKNVKITKGEKFSYKVMRC